MKSDWTSRAASTAVGTGRTPSRRFKHVSRSLQLTTTDVDNQMLPRLDSRATTVEPTLDSAHCASITHSANNDSFARESGSSTYSPRDKITYALYEVFDFCRKRVRGLVPPVLNFDVLVIIFLIA